MCVWMSDLFMEFDYKELDGGISTGYRQTWFRELIQWLPETPLMV